MQKKTYLITGAAGFIGGHFTRHLLAQGHTVAGMDNLETGSEKNIIEFLDHPNYSFARADISNELVLDRLASQADVIVHLAAAVGVMLIVERPVHTITTNVMGTEYVLDAALRYNCQVLLASTSEVYGKGIKIPFSEDDDILLGSTAKNRWGYAASKMVDEFLGLAYASEHGLDVRICRFFNTVGPKQTGRYGMVIPRFVRQALKNEPITVYGSGEQQRCFCDVRDSVKALDLLLQSEEARAKVVNIGSSNEVSMNGLAERIIELTNSQSQIKHILYEKAYAPGFEDMDRRVPDLSRIKSLTGWEAQLSLDEIILAVAECEKERMAQEDDEDYV